jgi:hypothetical protein
MFALLMTWIGATAGLLLLTVMAVSSLVSDSSATELAPND